MKSRLKFPKIGLHYPENLAKSMPVVKNGTIKVEKLALADYNNLPVVAANQGAINRTSKIRWEVIVPTMMIVIVLGALGWSLYTKKKKR